MAVVSGIQYLMYAGSTLMKSNVLDDESQQVTLPEVSE